MTGDTLGQFCGYCNNIFTAQKKHKKDPVKQVTYNVDIWLEELGEPGQLTVHHEVVELVVSAIIQKDGGRGCHPNWKNIEGKALNFTKSFAADILRKGPLFYTWDQYKFHGFGDHKSSEEWAAKGHREGKLSGKDGAYADRSMEPTEVEFTDRMEAAQKEDIDHEESEGWFPGLLDQKMADLANNHVAADDWGRNSAALTSLPAAQRMARCRRQPEGRHQTNFRHHEVKTSFRHRRHLLQGRWHRRHLLQRQSRVRW